MKKITSFNINIPEIIAGILLFNAWYDGQITGVLAWILLLLLIDFKITWKR